MITCPRCSRTNEPHYRFCLGCGFELSGGGGRAGTPQPSSTPPPATPVPQAPPPVSTPPPRPPGRSTAPPSGPFAQPPPDYIDAGLDVGTHLGAPPTEDMRRADTGYVFCRHCGNQVERGYAFCGACGKRVAGTPPPGAGPTPGALDPSGPHHTAPPGPGVPGGPVPAPFSPAANNRPVGGTRALTPYDLAPDRPPRVVAHLVRIEAGGEDGGSVPLADGETPVGRAHGGPLFAQDLYLSPLHATFRSEAGRLHVRDEGSLNGVFVRLKGETSLGDGDILRMGQELLRYEEFSDAEPLEAADGTQLHGSPEPGAWGRLVEMIAPDDHGNVHMLRDPEVVLGRSYGDITFPEDAFVSGTHCKVAQRGDNTVVTDLGSSNGTYLRARGEVALADGDLVLLGQQLFQLRHT